jgi:hypothetical protein
MTKGYAKLRLVWLITILIAFFSLVVGFLVGKAEDCGKGMNDAGCGLRIFEGVVIGAFGGIVIIGCTTVYTVVCVHRCRKIAAGSSRTSGEWPATRK